MMNLKQIIQSVVNKNARFFIEEDTENIISKINEEKLTEFSNEDLVFLKNFYMFDKVYAHILSLVMKVKTQKNNLTLSDLNVLSISHIEGKNTLYYLMKNLIDIHDLNTYHYLEDYQKLNEEWKKEVYIAQKIIESHQFKQLSFEKKKAFLKDLDQDMLENSDFIATLLNMHFNLFLEKKYHEIYDIISENNVIDVISSDVFKCNVEEDVSEWGFESVSGISYLYSKLSADKIDENDLYVCLDDRNFAIFRRDDIIEKFKNRNGFEFVHRTLKKMVEEDLKGQICFNSDEKCVGIEEWKEIIKKYE